MIKHHRITTILTLLAVTLVFSACTSNSTTPQVATDQQIVKSPPVKSICGNGILETGEDNINCCQDAACDEFFTCKTIEQEGSTINTCAKIKIQETKEYKDLLKYWKEESNEYNKQFENINFDIILVKVNQMNRSIERLAPTYNVTTESLFIKYRYERRAYNLQLLKIDNEFAANKDETKIASYVNSYIEVNKQELERLNSFSEEQSQKIHAIFDYDILEKREDLALTIKDLEAKKLLIDKGLDISLEISDYESTCYSDECYLDYVKINIVSAGGLGLEDPAFDFYIKDGDRVVGRDVDGKESELDSIPAGLEGTVKFTYIGYDDKEKIPPGTYTLTVNLKQGVQSNARATTSTTIRLQ